MRTDDAEGPAYGTCRRFFQRPEVGALLRPPGGKNGPGGSVPGGRRVHGEKENLARKNRGDAMKQMFYGGVHPAEHKEATEQKPIQPLANAPALPPIPAPPE